MKITQADIKRFWSKVTIGAPDKCWNWQACAKNYFGHGDFWVDGGSRSAHRIAWIIVYGEISGGVCVLHKCDNPPCCNPAHLFLGTLDDNNKDAASKKRFSSGKEHYSKTQPEKVLRGEKIGVSIHTEEDIMCIRQMYVEGYTYDELAEEFDTAKSTVFQVISGKTWTHIPNSAKETFEKKSKPRVSEEVRNKIKQEYLLGDKTQQELAGKYYTSAATVSRIARRS